MIRLVVHAAPVAVSLTVAYSIARFAPYWVLGVNRWLWWLAVFAVANTCLLLGDRLRARLSQRDRPPQDRPGLPQRRLERLGRSEEVEIAMGSADELGPDR